MVHFTPRERVLRSLEYEEPDRVPLDIGSYVSTIRTVKAYNNLKAYLGLPQGPVKTFHAEHVVIDEAIIKRLHADILYVRPRPLPREERVKKYPGGVAEDEWGIKFRRSKSSLYYELYESPLQNAYKEDLEGYDWPDPKDPRRFEGLEEEAKRLYEETDYCIGADHATPLFGEGLLEKAWYLRGLSRFLMDLILHPDFVQALLEKLHRLQIAQLDEYLDGVGDYVQIVMVMSDYGMQDRMLISPEIYRRFFKPYDRRLISFIKGKTEAKVHYHSCGSIRPIIPDLIECGVDILNPIQPRAKGMEAKGLKEDFGGKLIFHGGIDIQQVLPFGSLEDVEEEVKRVIGELGPGGGYILAPSHCIQPDVPPANLVAMYDATIKYGKYPLPPSP